ncbi:hypothetical protein BVRB_7g179330 [Beta vulgaris subsp. vulgaris]|uniref:RNase H type-1 domain-containing protein n=1 Tax=Beta vulgaris subsp. vulgaris TaxID=3555 RepID=A0A0J8BAU9_BETVV|nr:hypothetical protein BVRB_7g179330 [Beta vulgaris subsp. vulgaris]
MKVVEGPSPSTRQLIMDLPHSLMTDEEIDALDVPEYVKNMHKLKRNALALCQVNLEIAQSIREEGEKLSQDSISLDDSEVFNPDFLSQIDDICKCHLEAKDSANKVDPTISLLVKRTVELEFGRNENVPDLDSGVHEVEEKEGRDEDEGGDKDADVHGDGEEGGRRAGGLALLWSEEVDISLKNMGDHCIDVTVQEEGGVLWRFTGIYGWSESSQKVKTWEMMRELGENNNLAWLLVGDFNEVLYETEKNSRNPCDFASVQQFRSVVDELLLKDLGADGYPFTWSNRRADDAFVEERLDRALASESWMDLYSNAAVSNLIWDGSDHFPIVMNLGGHQTNAPTSTGQQRFRFEAKWLQEANFDNVMKEVWEEAHLLGMGQWDLSVKMCGEKLKEWDSKVYKKTPKRIRWLKKRLERLTDARVADLIDAENVSWRDEVLSEVFFDVDVRRIKNIHLSRRLPEDEICWVGSVDGLFKVRDAYRLAIENDNTASSSLGFDPIWKHIWALCIPPKVSNFLWRATWDILPHNVNLKKKRAVEESKCIRCGLEETTLHCFRDCEWVREAWAKDGTVWQCASVVNFKEWLAWIFEFFPKEQQEVFVMKIWQLWKCRNELIFQNTLCSAGLAWERAIDILRHHRKFNGSKREGVKRAKDRWLLPSPGFIKINVDAAVNGEYCRVGLGMVARDENGQVLRAWSRTMSHDWPAEKAEAAAVLWATEEAIAQGWSNVVLESDAQVIINAINSRLQRRGDIQAMLEDVLNLVPSFETIKFSFCYRECNEIAHRLAKWATSNFCDEVWLVGGPSWIADLIVSDSPNLII